MQIVPGALVQVRTADDRLVSRRALSGIERGQDFLVVWVCQEQEWEMAHAENREPKGTPWPAEEVHPLA